MKKKLILILAGFVAVLLGIGAVSLWLVSQNIVIGLGAMLVPGGLWLIWLGIKADSGNVLKLRETGETTKAKSGDKNANAIVFYADKGEGEDAKDIANVMAFKFIEEIPEGSRARAVGNLNNQRFHLLRNVPGSNKLVEVLNNDKHMTERSEVPALVAVTKLPDLNFADPKVVYRAIKMKANEAYNKYVTDNISMVHIGALVGVIGILGFFIFLIQ